MMISPKPQESAASEERTSFAHHGEDLEVLKYFGGKTGVFVEAGANHPIESSQTYLLEQRGWKGVLIEPNPHLAELCRQLRRRSQVFACALVEQGGPTEVQLRFPSPDLSELARVVSGPTRRTTSQGRDVSFACPARTLDDVLAEAGLGAIDFMSVDLEGYEAAALTAFDWVRWHPRLISVEDHCEDLSTWRRMRQGGYRFLRRIGDNDWYVPADAPDRAGLGETLKWVRKKFLSLPLRKFRRFSRRLRGRALE
ncbi:MAG: FkbM family methyltransferase [Verrucomicrobiales bacterium]|nr:FkbM family methyltransferase [Verrucomicrobiales bacterium]